MFDNTTKFKSLISVGGLFGISSLIGLLGTFAKSSEKNELKPFSGAHFLGYGLVGTKCITWICINLSKLGYPTWEVVSLLV